MAIEKTKEQKMPAANQHKSLAWIEMVEILLGVTLLGFLLYLTLQLH